MKVIVVAGKARHGKDTFARILRDILAEQENEVCITHYADLLKYICKEFLNWNGEKDKEGRTLLQTVGTDIVRSKSPDFWVNFIRSIRNFFPSKWDYLIIPDCRFQNEIDCWYDDVDVDVISIMVNRTGKNSDFCSRLTKEQQQHSSEILNIRTDYVIDNSGTINDFKNNIRKWVKEVL